MLEKLENIKIEIESEKQKVSDENSLEQFRLKYLSRNGLFAELFEEFKNLDKSQKGTTGKILNDLKKSATDFFNDKTSEFKNKNFDKVVTDLSLPGIKYNPGTLHLITQAIDQIVSIFQKIGFNIYDGPELEDEFHNFDALNTPSYHPSRDMQDTFFINDNGDGNKYLLRTHTTPGQIRILEMNKPPVRYILPGKCFRNEDVTARSLEMFHQIDGIYVNKNVNFVELKSTINYFAREFFGEELKIRWRPSYFPFTEPSAEVDVECYLCKGKGCKVCKYSGWLEILGCGMVHPEILKNMNIDPEVYSGYAFGMGIERTLMIKYGIPDIRIFYENDIRFLHQFKQ